MSTILGAIGLLALVITSALLVHIGLLTETRADGGRYIATVVVGVPYLAAVLLACIVALARGGFVPVWPGGASLLRGLLILVAASCAAAVVVVAVGMLPARGEAASAILARRLIWGATMGLLIVLAAVATFPALAGAWHGALLRGALALLALVTVVGALVLLQQGRDAKAAREAARDRPIPGLTAPREDPSSGRP